MLVWQKIYIKEYYHLVFEQRMTFYEDKFGLKYIIPNKGNICYVFQLVFVSKITQVFDLKIFIPYYLSSSKIYIPSEIDT